MTKSKIFFLAAVAFAMFQLSSCRSDDDPTFSIPSPTINEDGYSLGGTLKYLYSTDGGLTFSATPPTNIAGGGNVLIKVNNGTTDLTAEDFDFDWSGSSPVPSNSGAAVAEFTVTSNITVNVKIVDKMTMITSHRSNGKFFEVNPTTGATKELFTPTYGDNPLLSVRGFVYHYNKNLFYASVNTDAGGYLYTINPSTKVATRINENDGANGAAIWDAIVNWAVASDDSLVAVGDFNDDGNGIVKFGTNGGRSAKTAEAEICCALGMIYDASAKSLVLANGSNTNNGEVLIETFTQAGVSTGSVLITDFQSFPEDVSTSRLSLRCMVKAKDGSIYGNLFTDATKKTFFVKIDSTTKKITYISTLGADAANQYNSLAIVPNYTL